MAGPFQVDPNSAKEISPVRQQGGYETIVPGSSVLSDAASLLGAVAPYIEQTEKAKAGEELKGQLTSITSALKAAKYPNVQTELFTEEGLVNPSNKAAIKELQKLANASLQGKMPLPYVMERMDLVIREAVSAAPEWKPELEQVARDLLGFSPQHRMMNELFDTTEKLSPEQKGINKAKEEAAKLGVTVDQYQSMQLQMAQGEVEKQQMALRKSRDEYNANVAARDVQLSTGQMAIEFGADIRAQIAQGGVVNVEQTKALIMGAWQREKQRLVVGTPPGGDPGQMNANLKVLDEQRDSLLALTDNSDALNYIARNNKLTTEFAKEGLYAMEHIGPIMAASGSFEAGAALLDAMTRYADNPAAQALYRKSGQPGAVAWNMADKLSTRLAGVRSALGRYSTNSEAASDQERIDDVTTAATMLEQKKLKGTDAVPLIEWVKRSGGDAVSMQQLKKNKLVSNLSAVKEAHPQLINLYNSNLSRLQQEFEGLSQEGKVPPGGVQMDKGRVLGRDIVNPDGGASPSNGAYNNWVKHMNVLLDYADKYKATGVIPATMYKGGATIVDELNEVGLGIQNEKTMKSRETAAEKAQRMATEVRKIKRDAQGRLIIGRD